MENLKFATKKEALDYLWGVEGLCTNLLGQVFWPRGPYYLSHGEYSSPEYTPRRYKDGWGIHVKYYYYQGNPLAPKDGRLEYEPMSWRK